MSSADRNGQRKHHDSMSGDGYDACMRTTVTLDDDVVAALRTAMRERGVSFKEALNSAVRSGLSAANPAARPYQVKQFAAEIRPGVDITKINRLLGVAHPAMRDHRASHVPARGGAAGVAQRGWHSR